MNAAKVWEVSLLNKLYKTTDAFQSLESFFLNEQISFIQARNEIISSHKLNPFLPKIVVDSSIQQAEESVIDPQGNSNLPNLYQNIFLKEHMEDKLLTESVYKRIQELELLIKKPILQPGDDIGTLLTICSYLSFRDLFEHSFTFIKILDGIKTKNSNFFIEQGFEYIDVLVFSALGRCKSWKKIYKEARKNIPSLISWFEWIKNEHNEFTGIYVHSSLQTKRDQKIIKHKALLQKSNPEFLLAVKENNIAKVKDFLASSCLEEGLLECINTDDRNKNACHIACEKGDIEMVKLLIEAGCNLETTDCEEMTPLFYALASENIELVEFLISKGVNLEHGDCQIRTPFYWACSTCSLQVVKYLYSKGCKVNTLSKMNRSPLSKAAYTGRIEIVDFLLACPEVDVNEAGERGRTALQMAVWGKAGGRQGKKVGHNDAEDSPEIAQLLLEKGATINQRDHEGNTALFTAAHSLAEASIPVLMSFGATVNNQNNLGETPLFKASQKGYLGVCQVLFETYNADPFLKANCGHDSFETAIVSLQSEVVSYYIEKLGVRKLDQDNSYFDKVVSLIATTSFKPEEAVLFISNVFGVKNDLGKLVLSQKTIESLMNLKNEDILNSLIKWLKNLGNESGNALKIIINMAFKKEWIYALRLLSSLFQEEMNELKWSALETNLNFKAEDLAFLLENFNIDLFEKNDKNESFLHALVKNKNTKLLSNISQFLVSILPNNEVAAAKALFNKSLANLDQGKVYDFLNTKNSDGYSAYELALIHKNYASSTILKQLLGEKLELLFLIPSYTLEVAKDETKTMTHKQKEKLVAIENELLLEEGEGVNLKTVNEADYQALSLAASTCNFSLVISQRNIVLVETEQHLQQTASKIREQTSIIGVDMECYSDNKTQATFVCLMQISSIEEDYLIDCLKLHPLINQYFQPIFEAENIIKVFHGCDGDLKWLKSNFDIDVMNLFDTSRAHMLLNNETVSLGLSALTQQFLGFELDKTYQKADWRVRPLPKVMMEYGRGDSCVLLYLWYMLDNEMKKNENSRDLGIQMKAKMTKKVWKTIEESSQMKIKVNLSN